MRPIKGLESCTFASAILLDRRSISVKFHDIFWLLLASYFEG